MKIAMKVVATGFAALLLSAQAGSAGAAEIKVMSTNALQTALDELGPQFERATGHKLTISYSPSGAVVKRLQGGETTDVAITTQQGADTLVIGGKASADNVTVVARSGIGLAVRKGAPKPDISSAEALKRTLLAAKTITYSRPEEGGASGIHFAKVLDRLGIANEMKAKTVFLPKSGPVAVLVANGEAEIGVQQLPELIHVPGIEIIGPLPGDLQMNNVMAAVLMTGSANTAAAKALVNFLRTPEAAKLIKAKGMEPG
jgi:molybdate transport system substrate-binding protein